MDFKHMTNKGVAGFKRVAEIASDQFQATCITVEEHGKMRIDHDKLREILLTPEIGDKPIAIISISGVVRTGKSFMMNYFAKHLTNVTDKNWMNTDTNANCFKWKWGKTTETKGIRIANKIFKSKTKDGEEIVVLLMDTQGLFDSKTSEEVNFTLLTLSTLMSSVQIFNTMRQVNTQHLDYLKNCVDFAMTTAQTNEPYFKLQDLIFLVRDSPEACEEDDEDSSACALSGESFGFNCGEKYLNDVIGSLEGGAEQIATRQHIKKSFKNVRCFRMPHPGMAVLERNFSGKPEDLQKNFQECVKEFVEKIVHHDNLIPKGKGGKSEGMKARELLNMIAACDSIFAEKRYAAEDMMKANVKAYCSSECEETILEYDKKAKDIFQHDRMKTTEELQTRHKKLNDFALRRFETSLDIGDGKQKKIYTEYLENKRDDHCKIAMDRWEREIKVIRTAETARVFSEYENAIVQRHPKEPSVDEAVLVKLHESCLDELIKKNAQKIDIEKLKKKSKTHLENLLRVNREKQELEKKLVEKRQKSKLSALRYTLQDESSKFWTEKLMKCLTDKEITDHGQKIKKKLIAKYIDEALTVDEKNDLKALDEKMKSKYKKTDDVSVGKQELARETFYDKCSVHIRLYLIVLRNMLDKKLEEAKERNKENLMEEEKKVTAIIEGLVLAEERHLKEILSDRSIPEDKLRERYEILIKDFTNNALVQAWKSRDPHTRHSYILIANEKLKESQEKMKKLPAKTRHGTVQSTEDIAANDGCCGTMMKLF